MKKPEAEKAIRYLSTEWVREMNIDIAYPAMPSFSSFETWLHSKGYGHYLTFRSVRGSRADAEDWFDEELKQSWRN